MNVTWCEVPIHTLPTTLPAATDCGVLWQATTDEFLLDVPDQVRFWVTRHSPIQVARRAGVSDTALRLFLQGLPLAAYFVQRNIFTLHAAAVATPVGAVVLAGLSAAGKSTLAAAFVARGYALLADEVTPLTLGPDATLLVEPALPDLFLWRDAINKLGIARETCTMARSGLERYALSPQPTAADAQPLAALYLLSFANEHAPKMASVSGHKRFLQVQNHAYNHFLPATPAMHQQHFLQLTTRLAKCRIQHLRRPRSGWSVPDIVAAIEQELGL